MKLKGVPNQLISMDMSITVKCNDEGIIDLDKTLDNILNNVLIPRLTPSYPVIEETVEDTEETGEEELKEEKVYACKTCGEKIQGFGDFMTHCRTHKKEGDS